MNLKNMFNGKVQGKIRYNPDEDCFVLDCGSIDIGIMSEGFWSDYDEEVVEITIKTQDAPLG